MRVGRTVLAAATALLLVGGVAGPAASAPPASAPAAADTTPAGDTAPAAMTRAQAARVFLDAVCPANDAIDAMALAQQDPDVTWADLQPLARNEADAQMRLARRLGRPPRPWPANVRRLIPVSIELQLVQGGMNYVLAAAGSMEEYDTLLAGLRDYAPGLDPIMERWFKAKPLLQRRLGLATSGNCDGR